jgi:phenylpropionate dioxygenase-like ring-hydroxylating dioxygenase large terminal subunit
MCYTLLMGSPQLKDEDDRDGLPLRLRPPAAKPILSVVRLTNHWFVVATSGELKKNRPIARTLMGIPLALFRDGDGKPGALLDRCPHRNVPLSAGEVTGDGELQCAYHGWRFERDGACTFVPSLSLQRGGTSAAESGASNASRGRRAQAYPCVEEDGFVWVYPTAGGGGGARPERGPYRFTHAMDARYTTVRQVVEAESTMHAAIENALDVPHTAFLHRGLFRSKSRGIEITAIVRRGADRVEAEYVGEPRPAGVVGKLLSPSGGVVTHFDRFILPSIAEVEYRIGEENHIVVSTAMTPITDFHTRLYAVVSFRTRLPGWAIKPLLQPVALAIFRQDARILKMQTENIKRFGGEQFASTEIDVLGRHIWRLLKAAERGDVPKEETAHAVSGVSSDVEARVALVV